MTTRWRKLQFIGFSQKVLLVCNSPQAAGQQLPVRRDGDRICSIHQARLRLERE
jgi:hypothetical protein